MVIPARLYASPKQESCFFFLCVYPHRKAEGREALLTKPVSLGKSSNVKYSPRLDSRSCRLAVGSEIAIVASVDMLFTL